MQTFPLIWIPLVPLLGAAVLGILGNRLGRANINLIACGSIFTALAGSVIAVAAVADGATLAQSSAWFHVGIINVSWGFTVDRLSATLLLVITGIGFLIHVYSTGYMAHDPAPARFFAYLNLFVSAMLVLVLADNLVVLFVGWEGVGLCSYLLIGFWYEDPDKALAGRKAFIVNRIGDFGFTLAVFACIAMFGSVTFHGLMEQTGQLRLDQPLLQGVFAGWRTGSVITMISLLFLVGVAGKSAQIPLYVWLPDAMAGPTPVSALIHAATMVTAGVYLMCRLSFLYVYSGTALTVVGAVGAATALLAAVIACAQNDIKKVLAYSTVSQLGFMVLAVGVGAFWAAIAHLVTHAFFKACLFLTAGSVIHGMGEEQDVRRMGGLLKRLPQTGAAFIVATAAITGVVPLSGFFSKDAILSLVGSTRNIAAPWAPPLFYAVGSLAASAPPTTCGAWRCSPSTASREPSKPSTPTRLRGR
jgi:NADH-quinone oxidoreductase subunit L